MAHEISGNEAAFVVNQEIAEPWHRLGTYVDAHMTPKQALEAAHLNWEVDKVDLMARGQKVATHVATRRSDNNLILGVVGKNYMPYQNREQADFIEALVGEGVGSVECVGALYQGRRTFWTVRVPNDLIINKDDKIRKYLIVANANDGSLAFKAFWSSIRVVCKNTLNAALNNQPGGIEIRHTSRIQDRISQARQILDLTNNFYDRALESWQHMADTPVTSPALRAFLDAMFPIPEEEGRAQSIALNKRGEIVDRYTRKDFAGAKEAGDTVWGLFNTITYQASHVLTDRGTKDLSQHDRDSRKADSLIFDGSRAQLIQRAYTALTN